MFVSYHFCGLFNTPAYLPIHSFVSAFVFLTGFGNTL